MAVTRRYTADEITDEALGGVAHVHVGGFFSCANLRKGEARTVAS